MFLQINRADRGSCGVGWTPSRGADRVAVAASIDVRRDDCSAILS
jgi:hypothetical protein